MAFWRTIPLHSRAGWAALLPPLPLRFAQGLKASAAQGLKAGFSNSGSVALPPQLASPARRASLLQWAVVGVVSIVLGIFAIGAASLPSRWMPLAVLAALCPFVVAIVGNGRRFFLALILMDIPFALD